MIYRVLNPSGQTKKVTLSKQDLAAVVVDRNLADCDTANNLNRKDLLALLGETPNRPALSTLSIVSGNKFQAQAMHVSEEQVFIYDGASKSLWTMTLSSKRGKIVGEAKIVINTPELTHVCAITCTADYIYLASDTEDRGGLFR